VNYVEQGRFLVNTDCRFNLYLGSRLYKCLERIRQLTRPLGAYLEFHEGIHSGNVRAKLFVDGYAGREYRRLLHRGSEVSPFRVSWGGRWVRYDRSLVNRAAGEYANLGRARYFTQPKLLVRRTGDRIIGALDGRGFYASNNFFVAQPRLGVDIPLTGLEMLLNSRLATWYFRAIQPRTGRLFAEAKITHLQELPVPVALSADDWDWLSARAEEIRASLAEGDISAPQVAHLRSECDRRLLDALEVSWQELERAYPAGAT
jgi:TaqI-like C-terminal specificity domain